MRPGRSVAAVLALTVVATLVVSAATSTASFSAYNGAWDGGSRLDAELAAAGATPEFVTDTGRYATLPPAETVAVVLSPDEPYASAEAARVAAFVRAGGTLVVADDFGPHANALLAAVGARARLDGRLLRDDQYHYRASAFPVATVRSDALPGAETVTLNHATAVVVDGAVVAAASSRYAYLDDDADGELDAGERLGPYAVATVEPVGAGRVVVLGDPSVLINTMLDRPGNRAFLAALVGDADVAAVDVSHRTGTPPLVAAAVAIRETPALQVALGLGGVLAVAAWVGLLAPLTGRLPRVRRGGPGGDAERGDGVDPAVLAAHLAGRHPDWDPVRVHRVADALARSGFDVDADPDVDPDGRTA